MLYFHNLSFSFSFSADSLAYHVDMAKLPVYGGFVKNFVLPVTADFVKYGDFMTREDLANTLEVVQQQGADAFYRGDLGRNFVKMVSGHGQFGGGGGFFVTCEDF